MFLSPFFLIGELYRNFHRDPAFRGVELSCGWLNSWKFEIWISLVLSDWSLLQIPDRSSELNQSSDVYISDPFVSHLANGPQKVADAKAGFRRQRR